jgi:lipid II:glycine glycyltransferase (peptidoglycan interpeptide bridge formation enzyme)
LNKKLLFQKIADEKKNELPFSLSYSWWNEVVKTDWDVAIVANGPQVIAAWPYFIRKKGPWVFLTNPHFTPYTGPIIQYPEGQKPDTRISYENKIVAQLIEQLPEYAEFTQNFPPSFSNTLPFIFHGFDDSKRYTYLLNLTQTEENIWSNFRDNIRRQIRKAEKQLSIESSEEVNLLPHLLKESYEGQKASYPDFPEALFERIYHYIRQYNCGELWKVVDEQKAVHASLLIIHDEHTAYYLIGGAAKAYKNSGAMSNLLHHAIKWAKKRGLSYFNFEGSSIPSIEKYLRGFGGELSPFSHISAKPSKSLQWAKKIKK